MSDVAEKEGRTRDGSKQRAEWMSALAFHEKHVKRLKEMLARKPGTVSTRRVAATTRKWLEGMTVAQLHEKAERVGIANPEQYDDLDVLIGDILVEMGLEEREE